MSLKKTFRTVFMISSKSSIVTLERNLVIIVDLIQTKTKKVCSGNEQCLEILLYFLIRVPFLLCDSCTLFFVLKPFVCLTLFPPSLSHLLSHWEKRNQKNVLILSLKLCLSLYSLYYFSIWKTDLFSYQIPVLSLVLGIPFSLSLSAYLFFCNFGFYLWHKLFPSAYKHCCRGHSNLELC